MPQSSPSARIVALEFAQRNGLVLPATDLAISLQTFHASVDAASDRRPLAELERDAHALARALTSPAEFGHISEAFQYVELPQIVEPAPGAKAYPTVLWCRFAQCVPTTIKTVLMVGQLSATGLVSVQLFEPASCVAARCGLTSLYLVQIQRRSEQPVATGFRTPPIRRRLVQL